MFCLHPGFFPETFHIFQQSRQRVIMVYTGCHTGCHTVSQYCPVHNIGQFCVKPHFFKIHVIELQHNTKMQEPRIFIKLQFRTLHYCILLKSYTTQLINKIDQYCDTRQYCDTLYYILASFIQQFVDQFIGNLGMAINGTVGHKWSCTTSVLSIPQVPDI